MLLIRTKALNNFTAQALNSLTSESIDVSGAGEAPVVFCDDSSSERRKSCSSVEVSYVIKRMIKILITRTCTILKVFTVLGTKIKEYYIFIKWLFNLHLIKNKLKSTLLSSTVLMTLLISNCIHNIF